MINKTPVKIVTEGAFGGTLLKNIYSDNNSKWHRKSWKEFDDPKNIDQNCCCSNYYDFSVNK